MEEQNKAGEKNEMEEILQELRENPYQKFNLSFALMSVIPFLLFFYILAGRLFTIDIFTGDIGLVLVIAIFVSLCGLYLGYGILKKLLNRVISYAAKARKYSELKSTFVAHISHDFRNPLYAVSASIKDILEGMPDQVGEEARETLERCQAQMDRMWDLSTHMLDIYEIEE
ncbi:MAG: sensor histidine kinase [Candidatus Omnitrophota bacterium]